MNWQTIQTANVYWQRAIILIDMNAFFAAIEQLDQPAWRGRALAITNGLQGTCVITCSYEARQYGIQTGMRLPEAKRLCRDLIQVAARPDRYVEVSRAIMQALSLITPDIEIFSVDEAFLDVTNCQLLFGSPEKIGLMAKEKVFNASGLQCSIGVSGDKTTAKFAAKLQKPDGFSVIPPWEAKARLKDVPVTALCGIKSGVGNFLAQHGVSRCGDMEKLPISILAKRFGNIGRRIWYMCQGADPDPVHTRVPPPKTMGHGKVMPPNTCSLDIIRIYLMHMCEKLGERLRAHHYSAQQFFAGLLNHELGWFGGTAKNVAFTNDGRAIYELASYIIQRNWSQQPVSQIQVTALDPHQANQLDMFQQINEKRHLVNQVMDNINHRFGEYTIAPLPLLQRSSMPNVIAPAWKPYGHRQNI